MTTHTLPAEPPGTGGLDPLTAFRAERARARLRLRAARRAERAARLAAAASLAPAAAPRPEAEQAPAPDLGAVAGIGPAMRLRLAQLGIARPEDLAGADPAALREGLGAISRLLPVEDWIAAARGLRAG
jgi:predicted flap endonuclease-1-like 5' DNA nuclease